MTLLTTTVGQSSSRAAITPSAVNGIREHTRGSSCTLPQPSSMSGVDTAGPTRSCNDLLRNHEGTGALPLPIPRRHDHVVSKLIQPRWLSIPPSIRFLPRSRSVTYQQPTSKRVPRWSHHRFSHRQQLNEVHAGHQKSICCFTSALELVYDRAYQTSSSSTQLCLRPRRL